MATRILHGPQNLPRDETFRVPGIEGIAIRIPWEVIQPTADRYDWTLLDHVVRRSVASGKKISIGVVAGAETPKWLAAHGVPFHQFMLAKKGCVTVSAPDFWDQRYTDAYIKMMQSLRDRLIQLNAFDAVEIVKITGISQSSIELRMPIDNRCARDIDDQWASFGYRPSKIIAAWSKMADGVAQAFPGRLLVQPILQKQGFPTIDESGRKISVRQVDAGSRIISICIEKFKAKCGVQWNALKLQGPMAQRVFDAQKEGANIGWQTNLYEGPTVGAGCQVDRRADAVACSESTYTALLKRGVDTGAFFIEVWEPDMRRYPDAFKTAGTAWKY